MPKKMTVVIEKMDNVFTAKCLDVDVISQGKSIGQALDRMAEAITLYLEKAKPKPKDIYVATIEVGA